MATADGPLAPLIRSWLRSLRAAAKPETTIKQYRIAVTALDQFLAERQLEDLDVRGLRSATVDWLAKLNGSGYAPATVYVRFAACSRFFTWCVAEEELPANPMAGLERPGVPEKPVQVPAADMVTALLKSTAGRDFRSRRDHAIIRLLADTGMRRGECAALKVTDIDLDAQIAYITGKGNRPRVCPFGAKTAQALDRYLRARSRHKGARLDDLWLTEQRASGLSYHMIGVMVRDRAAALGFELHPHQLRHLFAHTWKAEGGNEDDLMRLGGWRSHTVMRRYGSALADERAREAHRRMSLGDRF